MSSITMNKGAIFPLSPRLMEAWSYFWLEPIFFNVEG